MAGLGTGTDWRAALDEAMSGLQPEADLVLIFASDHYRDHFDEILAVVREQFRSAVIAGCTGQAIIARDREIEDQPSLSIMPLAMPGVELRPIHLRQEEVVDLEPEDLQATLVGGEDVNAWLIFANPFSFDVERIVTALEEAFPETPILGGMASASTPGRVNLFLDDAPLPEGCILVAISGDWTLHAVVSQGTEPLGEAWTITSAEQNIVREIGGRPALEVLIETVQSLPVHIQERAGQNLLVGLAIDEYREHFGRGDFLVRNLMGADRKTGAIAINAAPRVGQTIQFHMRDSTAAGEELRLMLETARLSLGSVKPAGALLCTCNGRGQGLFGEPDHDAKAIAARFEALPVAGFFCNGEIGPVGSHNFVHGFTASIGLFVPKH